MFDLFVLIIVITGQNDFSFEKKSHVLVEFVDKTISIMKVCDIEITSEDILPEVGNECVVLWGQQREKNAAKVLHYHG